MSSSHMCFKSFLDISVCNSDTNNHRHDKWTMHLWREYIMYSIILNSFMIGQYMQKVRRGINVLLEKSHMVCSANKLLTFETVFRGFSPLLRQDSGDYRQECIGSRERERGRSSKGTRAGNWTWLSILLGIFNKIPFLFSPVFICMYTLNFNMLIN